MKFLIFVSLSWYLYLEVIGDNATYPLNFCMNALYHKKIPGPEAELHGECTPWKDRACCFTGTTKNIDMMYSYDFNFNHCSHERPMSSKCQTHFKRDMCFYECEPNLGPWIIPVNMKMRKQRFYKVPLCASECDQWFEDCKHDYTCAKNWIKDFKWNRTNHCLEKCITFEEMYGNSSNFCQLVWDESWEYTPDDKPCMKIWFDPAQGNPNDAVFQNKMNSIIPAPLDFATEFGGTVSFTLISVCTIIFVCMLIFVSSLFMGYLKFRDRIGRGPVIC